MNSGILWCPILIPIAAGVICLVLPKKLSILTKLVAFAATGMAFGYSIFTFTAGNLSYAWPSTRFAVSWTGETLLASDRLTGFLLLAAGFFGLLILFYSFGFFAREKHSESAYYGNYLLALGATFGAILSSNLLLLLIFWGFLGLPFFLLVNMGSEKADAAAKKTLIILGGSDSLLIMAVAILWVLTGSLDMGKIAIATKSGAATLAYIFFVAAAFAKAGAFPLHSWVPDAAEASPAPVAAFLPASLDKLLGVYLFARATLSIFQVTPGLRSLMMILGAVTIISAVMMALVQHNLRRLLGFHAVSQVGYMVLGIATGTLIGVAGGLFHMLNHALYKSCLFLTAGAAEQRSKSGELSDMGGLAKSMPLTFFAAVVAALAISGVPPLNGFYSKWMVYQGIIELGSRGGLLWVFLLVAAMFGSALTLASFVKVLHSVFLGRTKEGEAEVTKGRLPNFAMKLPMIVIALICIVFGVWAYRVPIASFINPGLAGLGLPAAPENSLGFWAPGLATILLIVALVAGALIFVFTRALKVREDVPYVGGEIEARAKEYQFSGLDFYKTVPKMGLLSGLYRAAEAKWLDLYDVGRRLAAYITGMLRTAHSGVLSSYMSWCVLGLIVLIWLLIWRVW
ncbi:MAG: NADH-quinone oxidoreductase subunit L [Candidatus Coatesbacteria bacterium]|nr:NADH-quinone oxidoreductase subunit L [Candidatus Coatesbacteria bacterium]